MPEKSTTEYKINRSFKYYDQAQAFRAKGNHLEAVEYYRKTIENNPSFQAPYTILQYTPIAPAQLNSLIYTYKQVLQQQPDLAFAWSNLGDVLTQQGDLKAAQTCYQTGCYHQALNSHPDLAEVSWPQQKQSGPEFIIIGASRCGTTSLYNYLSCHPQVLLPVRKELDFFASQSFHHGRDWYLAHFPALADQPDFITGEATPSYFDLVGAPKDLHDYFPKTKLILVLRDPIERAISWHHHKVRSGFEKSHLLDSIFNEMEALENMKTFDLINLGYQHPNNLNGSLYVYKMMRWLTYFRSNQLLILKSEDLYQKPQEVMHRVFKFLQIPNYESLEYLPYNNLEYPSISPSLRERMRQFFAPHNQKLEQYLNQEFHWH